MIPTGKLPDNWDADLPKWKPTDKPIATRVAGGEVMNALAKQIPNMIGGSAELNPSTNTALKGLGIFNRQGPGLERWGRWAANGTIQVATLPSAFANMPWAPR